MPVVNTVKFCTRAIAGMELSWQFRISHYLNKNPADFKWLVKMLRCSNEILASKYRRELDRVLLKYEKDGPYPESLIKRLCQQFTEDTARDMTDAVFPNINRDSMTSHKDYTVKCPIELVIAKSDLDGTATRIAKAKMLELLGELTEEEMQRMKVFLGETVVEGVWHIPYGIIEDMQKHALSGTIVNRLQEHYKCVVFAILTTLGRNDLITYLQVPYDTTLVA